VPTNHHADPSEVRVEHRIPLTRQHAAIDFFSGQADLSVLADKFAVPADENARVVMRFSVALVQTGHNVNTMLLGALSKEARGWPRNGLSYLGMLVLRSNHGDGFGKANDVRLGSSRLINQVGELF